MKTKNFFSRRLIMERRIFLIPLLLVSTFLLKQDNDPTQNFLSTIGLNESSLTESNSNFTVETIDFIDGIAGIISTMEIELSANFLAVLTAHVGNFIFNLIPNLIQLIL